MKFSDATLGVFFLIAGIALGWYAYGLPPIPGQQYGAATFPLLISFGFIVCSAKFIYSGVRQGDQSIIWLAPELRNPRALASVAATVLLVIGYVLFVRAVGFIPMAIFITFTMFLILKVNPAKSAIISVIAAFACDFIFRTMLLVPLPFGIVPRLPW